jgi:hypothetical protein
VYKTGLCTDFSAWITHSEYNNLQKMAEFVYKYGVLKTPSVSSAAKLWLCYGYNLVNNVIHTEILNLCIGARLSSYKPTTITPGMIGAVYKGEQVGPTAKPNGSSTP